MALPPNTSPPRRPNGKKVELTFEPLSDGLGFHPFSDGLPYAPIGKTPSAPNNKSGANAPAGATVAGLPSYSPPPAPPRAQVPPMRAPQPFSHPKIYKQPQAPIAQKPAAAEALPEALTSELLQPTFGFSYLFKRVFAYALDSLFNLSLCAGALSLALWKQDLSPELLLTPGIILVAALFLGFFNWAITTAEEVAFGTSIGKRMFGLAIQGNASAIFLRAFFFIPGICFGGLGLLWALFDRRRRCWHDLVVDIQPIEIARL